MFSLTTKSRLGLHQILVWFLSSWKEKRLWTFNRKLQQTIVFTLQACPFTSDTVTKALFLLATQKTSVYNQELIDRTRFSVFAWITPKQICKEIINIF